MAELITEVSDEELVTKLRAKRRIRGLLIVINFVLFGYLAFNIGSSIVDLVEASKRVDGLVSLKDKSPKESLEIYKEYIKSDDDVIGGDFAIYGDNILITKNNFDIENIDVYQNVQLAKIQENKSDLKWDVSLSYTNIDAKFSSGINIFNDVMGKNLPQGDYFFYIKTTDNTSDDSNVGTNNMGKILKVNNGLEMKYVNYSLPNEEGERVKSTIYAYKDNPALIMNIEYVYSLPDDYVDVLVIGNQEHYQLINDKIAPNSKVRYEEKVSDEEAYLSNARTIIKIIDDDKTNVDSDIIYSYSAVDSDYSNKDNSFVLAMAGYANSKGYPYQFKSEHFMGIMTYVIDIKN